MDFAKIFSRGRSTKPFVILAIRLSGLRALPQEMRQDYDRFSSKLLDRQLDFLSCLHELTSDYTLELRYSFDPKHSQEIGVYLLVKFIGKTKTQLIENADLLGTEFLHLASINNHLHEFDPVTNPDELQNLLDPFPLNHIAEIVRREDMIDMDCLGKNMGKRHIGFSSEQRPAVNEASPSDMYYVYPLSLHLDNVFRLCSRLLLQDSPTLVSIRLKKYELSDNDKTFLESRVGLCEKYAQLTLSSHGDPEEMAPFLKLWSSSLYQNCSKELVQLQDAAFSVKVQVSSTKAIPQDLIALVGTTLTESSGHPNLPFPREMEGSFTGGYDWVLADSAPLKKTAASDFSEMSFSTWAPSIAPEKHKHFRYIFSVNQAAMAFRLPLPTSEEFPGIDTLRNQFKQAPFDLPKDGLLIGEAKNLNYRRPVYINPSDRSRHMYVVGQTGTGKSTLFRNMILQDIQNGQGVGVIDPHGELVDSILSSIPPERSKDVILIDPQDYKRPIGINFLECNSVFDRDYSINYFLEVFDQLYDLKQTGGPIFEQYLRNALQLLLEQPPPFIPTILDATKVFQDRKFRRKLLKNCRNMFVVNFWKDEAEQAGGDARLENIAPYINSKMTRFINNEIVRVIIAQRESTINFEQIINEGKILLVDLRKGVLGASNCHFLGMLIVGKILAATLGRTKRSGQGPNKNFYLYVDEFHNLATNSFVSIFSEARKYGLSLTITNQYVSQLKNEITAGIFGNVGTLIGFRLGSLDAEQVSKEFSCVVSENDLMGLPNWQTYVRLSNNGQVCAPFSMNTLPPVTIQPAAKPEEIKRFSRNTYGRPLKQVEKQIRDNWAFLDEQPVESNDP